MWMNTGTVLRGSDDTFKRKGNVEELFCAIWHCHDERGTTEVPVRQGRRFAVFTNFFVSDLLMEISVLTAVLTFGLVFDVNTHVLLAGLSVLPRVDAVSVFIYRCFGGVELVWNDSCWWCPSAWCWSSSFCCRWLPRISMKCRHNSTAPHHNNSLRPQVSASIYAQSLLK